MENGNGVGEKPFEGQAKDGAHKFIMEPSNMNMQFSPERLSRTELGNRQTFLFIHAFYVPEEGYATWLRCLFSVLIIRPVM